MRKYTNIALLSVILVIFSGCFGMKNGAIEANKKSFEHEDLYILSALYLEELKDYSAASNLFELLYKESGKKEYLYRSLRDDLVANENKRVIQKVDALVFSVADDYDLTRIKIAALIKEGMFLEARDVAIKLTNASKSVKDYLLLSDIFVELKEYETALKYLEGAYIKEYDELILEKMAIILYVNLERKKDAIAQLESHSRIHGCSENICSKLLGFYSNDNNIEGLLSTYLRLYKIDSSKDTAQKIVQIYGYKRDFTKMIAFLEESRADNELLLQFYGQTKRFKDAFELATKLYKESGDIYFLAQSAIYEYEGSKNKSDATMHKSVIKKFEEVLETKREGVYLNFVGYLLIDHDIDVKRGIEYVKEALKQEPKSVYYLDSLAWGYYKLGECKKADSTMKKVLQIDDSENEEVLYHINMIKECLKKQKGEK